jgi:hypothetical protein
MDKLVEYIKQTPKAHFMIHGRIPVYFKNGLTKKINMDSVCKRVGNILPAYFFRNISAISIGQYDTLDDRSVDSVYNKKIIFTLVILCLHLKRFKPIFIYIFIIKIANLENKN